MSRHLVAAFALTAAVAAVGVEAEPLHPAGGLSFFTPSATCVADFDGDGLSDVVGTTWYVNDPRRPPVSQLFFYRAGGVWSFGGPLNTGTSLYPSDVVAGDLNHDYRPDVVIGLPVFASMEVYRNDGGTSFAYVNSAAIGRYPRLLADMNGDGHLDLVASDGAAVSVSPGHGDFTFGPTVVYSGTAGTVTKVAAGDLNGDGRIDLVASTGSGNVVRILLGEPSGGLTPSPDLPFGSSVDAVALGDLDGDGALDLAVGSGYSLLAIFKGIGDGTFGERLDYAVTGAADVVIAELDGDGHDDVAATGSSPGKVTVWHGVGDRTLSDRQDYTPTGTALHAVDIDNDGRTDLVAGSSTGVASLVRTEGAVTSVPGSRSALGGLALASVAPNPSSHGWSVAFTLPAEGRARLTLLDLAGRRVDSRALGTLPAGDHQARFVPGGTVAPGVYWLRLELDSGHSVSRPCIVR